MALQWELRPCWIVTLVLLWTASTCEAETPTNSTTDANAATRNSSENESRQSLSQKSSSLRKVVEMLEEMEKELAEMQAQDEKQYQEFLVQSNRTIEEAKNALDEHAGKAAVLEASILSAEAFQAEKQGEMDSKVTDLMDVQSSKSLAEGLRMSAKTTGKEVLATLAKGAHQISLALEEVEGRKRSSPPASASEASQSLLQATRDFERAVDEDSDPEKVHGDLQDDRRYTLQKAVAKLREAMAAGAAEVLSPAQRQFIDSLPIEEEKPRRKALGFLQVRSRTRSSRQLAESSKQLTEPLEEMLEEVQSEASKEYKSATLSEAEAKKAMETSEAVYNEQIEQIKQQIEELKLQLAESNVRLSKEKGEMQLLSRNVNVTKKRVSELQRYRAAKSYDFEQLEISRTKEMDAIAKARKILNGSEDEKELSQQEVLSFLQTSRWAQERMAATFGDKSQNVAQSNASARRSPPAKKLAALTLSSQTKRATSAQKQGGDRLTQVKQMVKDMIKKLKEVQAQDTQKNDWCKREEAYTLKTLEENSAKLEKLVSDEGVLSAELESLKSDMAMNDAKIKDLKKALADAEDLRYTEKQKAAKDIPMYQEDARSIKSVIAILNQVYGDLAESKASGYVPDRRGSGAIGMLEMSAESFEELAAKTLKAEEDAAKEFKELRDTTQVELATRETEAEYNGRTRERKSLAYAELKKDVDKFTARVDASKQ